ncbi:MAG: hypothetical protein WBC73_00265 [Phormidesmis sp.]
MIKTSTINQFSWKSLSVHVSIRIAVLTLATLPLLVTDAAQADPCTYRCASNQIRFIPGQPITIEFVNKTTGMINLERVLDIDLHWLRPQSDFTIQTLVGVDDDMSLVFWDENNRAVDAILHRPDAQTLQIELLPSGAEGDRAVHVANDGRVLVY